MAAGRPAKGAREHEGGNKPSNSRKALKAMALERTADPSARLLDVGACLEKLAVSSTWVGSGLFATWPNPADREMSPRDGKIAGFGKASGTGAVSEDFTVFDGSSGATLLQRIRCSCKRVNPNPGLPKWCPIRLRHRSRRSRMVWRLRRCSLQGEMSGRATSRRVGGRSSVRVRRPAPVTGWLADGIGARRRVWVRGVA